MDANEYQYLADTLAGRRARDFEFESRMTFKAEGSIAKAAIERERLNASKTHEERELEQRQFSLRMYGRENMLRYAHPITSDRPLGELQIPGDLVRGAAPQTHARVEERKLKSHNGEKREETWRDATGRLKLQFHEGEPGCYMQKEI